MSRSYAVVTPVRDEARHVGLTIKAMASQTIKPAHWVIVDDGSTDGTATILDQLAHSYPWMTIVHRPNRGFRANGGGVMDAFHAGLAVVGDFDWEYMVKLDADLSFASDYFEQCFARFEAQPRLGIGGGTICALEEGVERVEFPGDPRFHVRGATKIYRRACWNQITPLIKAAGWDTIDEIRANLFGWQTTTFADLTLVQHKATGSADGSWANSFKNGKANYITGYHPAFMAAKCVQRLLRKPYLVDGIAMSAGFLSGYFKRVPQLADAETIKYLRRQQMRRLLLRPSIYD
jgi:glycosyltransferase involved in cell wall biosynthesis